MFRIWTEYLKNRARKNGQKENLDHSTKKFVNSITSHWILKVIDVLENLGVFITILFAVIWSLNIFDVVK